MFSKVRLVKLDTDFSLAEIEEDMREVNAYHWQCADAYRALHPGSDQFDWPEGYWKYQREHGLDHDEDDGFYNHSDDIEAGNDIRDFYDDIDDLDEDYDVWGDEPFTCQDTEDCTCPGCASLPR